MLVLYMPMLHAVTDTDRDMLFSGADPERSSMTEATLSAVPSLCEKSGTDIFYAAHAICGTVPMRSPVLT